jgi:adenylate cyclase
LELRAVVSRARLSQREGDIGETRQALAEICGSFTEGAETQDLRKAKALLASL